MQRLLIAIASLACSVAQATDFIRITYRTGYPMPGASSENSQIYISSDADAQSSKEIDKFFKALQVTLDAARAAPIWNPPQAIHADSVRVEIALGSRRHVLEAGYGANGPQISLNAPEIDKRHLAALREILRLTTDRMKQHLLGERQQ